MTPDRKIFASAIASFAATVLLASSSFAGGLVGGLIPPPPPPVAGVLGGAGALPPPPAVPSSIAHALATPPISTSQPNPLVTTGLQALPKTPSLGGLPVNAQPLEDTALLALGIAAGADRSASSLTPAGINTLTSEGQVLLPVFTQLAVADVGGTLPSGSQTTMLTNTIAPFQRDLNKSGGPAAAPLERDLTKSGAQELGPVEHALPKGSAPTSIAPIERDLAKSGAPLNPVTALGSVPKL